MHFPIITSLIKCFPLRKAQEQPTSQAGSNEQSTSYRAAKRPHVQRKDIWKQTRKSNIFLATQGVLPHQIFKDSMVNKYNSLYFSPSLRDVKVLIDSTSSVPVKVKASQQSSSSDSCKTPSSLQDVSPRVVDVAGDDDLAGEVAEDFPVDPVFEEPSQSKSLIYRINQRLNPFSKQDSEKFLQLSIASGLSSSTSSLSTSNSSSSSTIGSSWEDPLWVRDDYYRRPKDKV